MSEKINQAIAEVATIFPFRGYMNPGGTTVKGAYHNITETVVRYIAPGSSILDFGCGPCEKLAVLGKLGYIGTGYDDLSDEWHRSSDNFKKILSFASENRINLHLAENGPMSFERNSFDLVMCNDVLEHLHDSPRELFNSLVSYIRPDGILLVTVPNAVNIRKRLAVLMGETNMPAYDGYYWYPGNWRGHIREYVRSDLKYLAEFLGLVVLELRGCDHMLEKVPVAARPMYLAITNVLTGLKDSWTLVARKPTNWSPKLNLPAKELAAILQRASSYDYVGS